MGPHVGVEECDCDPGILMACDSATVREGARQLLHLRRPRLQFLLFGIIKNNAQFKDLLIWLDTFISAVEIMCMIWNTVDGLSMVMSQRVAFGSWLTNAGTAGVEHTLQCGVVLSRSELTDNIGLCHGICAHPKDDILYPPQLLGIRGFTVHHALELIQVGTRYLDSLIVTGHCVMLTKWGWGVA